MHKENARNYVPGIFTFLGFLDEERARFYRRNADTNVLEHCGVVTHPNPDGAHGLDKDVNEWSGPRLQQRWKPDGEWVATDDATPHPFRTWPEERAIQKKGG